MINFDPVEVDDDSILNTIISNKRSRKKAVCDVCKADGKKSVPQDCDECNNVDNKQLLTDIKPYILSRYKLFRENTNSIDNIVEEGKIGERERKLLEDSFQGAETMKRLKIQIKEYLPIALTGKCPYCMISAHNTIDHYFDKSTFPEFALFSKNLIRCCSECNSYKGTKLKDANGKRETINFYYDVLPNRQFIFFDMIVDFSSPDFIPSFEIRLDLDKNNQNECTIWNHFHTLHLIQRYKDQIPEKVSTTLEEAQMAYSQGHVIDDVISALEIRIIALRKTNGLNYWEACLYDGIIKQKDVFERLLQQRLLS